MEDTHLVTVLNPFDELKEDVFDSVILSQIPRLVEDLVEEVVGSGVLHDEVGELLILYCSVALNDPGVPSDLQMEIELADVSGAATFGFAHALHCVFATPLARDVDAEEDDTVTPVPEDADELDGALVDKRTQRRVGASSG